MLCTYSYVTTFCGFAHYVFVCICIWCVCSLCVHCVCDLWLSLMFVMLCSMFECGVHVCVCVTVLYFFSAFWFCVQCMQYGTCTLYCTLVCCTLCVKVPVCCIVYCLMYDV